MRLSRSSEPKQHRKHFKIDVLLRYGTKKEVKAENLFENSTKRKKNMRSNHSNAHKYTTYARAHLNGRGRTKLQSHAVPTIHYISDKILPVY